MIAYFASFSTREWTNRCSLDVLLLDQLKTILRRDPKLGLTAPIADDMPPSVATWTSIR